MKPDTHMSSCCVCPFTCKLSHTELLFGAVDSHANAHNRCVHLDLCCNAELKPSNAPLALQSIGSHCHYPTHLLYKAN